MTDVGGMDPQDRARCTTGPGRMSNLPQPQVHTNQEIRATSGQDSGSTPAHDRNPYQIGGLTMDIILNVDPGPELVRLINQLGQEVEGVDQVVVDAFVPELSKDHSIGAFEPTTKTIIIDIGHCLTDYRWMKYGALFITNVWLNMVIAVFHEFAHADQLASGDVTIEEMDQDKDIHTLFEDDAVTKAMQEAYTYFSDGGIVPPLRELGWVGEHIAQTFNNTYNEIPEQIMEEIEAHKVGAAVDMKTAMAALPRFNEENMRLAYENVDNKQGGVKLDGKYYMTMGEFIASTKERTTYTK